MAVGTTSAFFTFTITNIGTAVSRALNSSTVSAGFSLGIDGCAGAKLAVNAACTVQVAAAPQSVGPTNGQLLVSEPSGASIPATLTETGATAAALAFESLSYTVPNPIAVGAPSATLILKLKNTGGVASGLLPVLATTGDSAFAVTGGSCAAGNPLASGATCSIQVSFTPTSFGVKTGGVSVTASPGGTATTSLAGTGTQSFKLTVQLGTGNGTGSLFVDGNSCAPTCTFIYVAGATTPVATVTQTPDVSSDFTSWGTDCSGNAGCAPTMSSDRTVVATFKKKVFTVTVNLNLVHGATGNASTVSGPVLTCAGTVCSGQFDYGTAVPLVSKPSGSTLHQSWDTQCADRFATVCTTPPLTSAFSTTLTLRPTINYMFVSSDTMYPVLPDGGASIGSNLLGADRHCDQLARNAGLFPTPNDGGVPYFKAFMSTTSTPAKARLASARGWIRPDGREFADTPLALFSQNQVFYPPTVSDLGGPVAEYAITGTAKDGTLIIGSNCNNFTSTGAIYLGDPRGTSELWTARQNNGGCQSPWRIYCFETAFSTPVSPAPPPSGRRAFVTAGQKAGSVSVATADALCNTEATAANLPGTYLAVLSTTLASASSRFSGPAPWARVDGAQLAPTGPDQLAWSNTLAPISQDAAGNYIPGFSAVWVGSNLPNAKSTSVSESCGDWLSGVGATGRIMASPSTLGDNWGWFLLQACDTPARFYCLQQ